MKFFLTNLALFIVFVIVFSSFSACGGASTNAGSGNAASVTNTKSNSGSSTSSTYPPLASGIATADMELIDGTTAKLADRKGKVILLNLWGIWCPPCRAEMPHLVELQEKYKDQGFQVIGLNVGDEDQQPEPLENIKTFGEKMKLNYELVRASREMTNQIYRLASFDAVPISLLIDREGHLRAVLRGGGPNTINQIKEYVAKTLDESPANSVDNSASPAKSDSVPAKTGT